MDADQLLNYEYKFEKKLARVTKKHRKYTKVFNVEPQLYSQHEYHECKNDRHTPEDRVTFMKMCLKHAKSVQKATKDFVVSIKQLAVEMSPTIIRYTSLEEPFAELLVKEMLKDVVDVSVNPRDSEVYNWFQKAFFHIGDRLGEKAWWVDGPTEQMRDTTRDWFFDDFKQAYIYFYDTLNKW